MSQRGPAFILPNVVNRNYTTVTSPGTSPTGMEPSYLKTEEPSDRSRILSLDPLYTRWKFAFGGIGVTFGGVGAANVNLSPHGWYRIVAHEDKNDAVVTLTAPPNAITTSTNRTGAVTTIDEAISSPDSSYMVPTDTSQPWTVELGWGALAATPKLGARMAQFVVRANISAPTGSGAPTVKAFLYESGIEKSFLGKRAITAEAPGEVFHFPFDFASLTDPTGSNLELRLSFEIGTASIYARLEAVQLYYESAADTYLHDSGVIANALDDFSEQDGPQPTRSLPYWLPANIDSVEAFELILIDDQADHLAESELDGAASAGALVVALSDDFVDYIDVGTVLAGPALFVERGILKGQGPYSTVIVSNLGGTTIGGQTYGADIERRRSLPGITLTGTRDDLLTLQDRLAWRRGRSGAFFFAAEPDIPVSRQLFTSGLWTCAEFGEVAPMIEAAHDEGDGTQLHQVVVSFEEKL